MDRADEVARIWERNNIKYPFLSEEVRMPFSARARQQALWQIDQAKEAIMADISKKAGLWMFFDSKCNYCHSQFDTVSMLQQKYRGMEIRFISTDGGVIKGMPADKIRFDHGASSKRAVSAFRLPRHCTGRNCPKNGHHRTRCHEPVRLGRKNCHRVHRHEDSRSGWHKPPR